MQFVRGARAKLDDILDPAKPFRVIMHTDGCAVYDTCCFGVDGAGKLSDDRYMVFYNQPVSPGNALSMSNEGGDTIYTVDLAKLPASVVRLVFTVSIDGAGTMGEVAAHRVGISQDSTVRAELSLSGSDFSREKAIIDIEIYNKTGWRCSAVARGFDGGLAELLKHYGGKLETPQTPPTSPKPVEPVKPVQSAPHPTRQSSPVRQPNPAPAPVQPTSPAQYGQPAPRQNYSSPQAIYSAPRPVQPTSPAQYGQSSPQPNYSSPQASYTSSQKAQPGRPVQLTQPASQPNYTGSQNAQPSRFSQPSPRPVQPAGSAQYGNVAAADDKQLADRLMKRINLSKDKVKLEKHVVNLSKCVVDLSKKNGVDLGNTRAKVVVALDYSGSMSSLYRDGVVQETLNRLVPLGLTFDDNGSIDIFLFQTDFRKMDDLNLLNYENYVRASIFGSGYYMGGTCYAPVLKAIIEGFTVSRGFFKGSEHIPPIVDNTDPTFILFITDGENADRAATDMIIRSCSEKNVFIQFIGIGNSTFEYLEKLDDMAGRKRDNTGFSKMADLAAAGDDVLYRNVLEQFSMWLKGLQ